METTSNLINKDVKGEACQNEKIDSDVVAAAELEANPPLSWKERLLGKSSRILREKNGVSYIKEDDNFTFMEETL